MILILPPYYCSPFEEDYNSLRSFIGFKKSTSLDFTDFTIYLLENSDKSCFPDSITLFQTNINPNGLQQRHMFGLGISKRYAYGSLFSFEC